MCSIILAISISYPERYLMYFYSTHQIETTPHLEQRRKLSWEDRKEAPEGIGKRERELN